MAMKRGNSSLLAVMLCFLGAWALVSLSQTFVVAPATESSLRGAAPAQGTDMATAAALGAAIAAVPQAAHAATAGYAVLQVGWALFFIALGPAFLLWVYFNKPELL
mmetsp:Transcript_30401/g.70912  ORF Transcript_30401/g.70912 Transcript_30401/m.70912 type:complete len:106 (+) Transcript_30401:98-415(+)|eukprot:CAMPEP_0178459284 /NCGR_PEP_ID=MMETSP0689_2-20121128/48040_1 /TAXON_ID=160604 /ORGANISM="Amphidinium massartii, Strain CS-259" /LENGTH=105 /DNA_ID=CAMNT_0020085735 /DNA_START=99 /DNA_END=416 /DNA_ORIENTATION=-